jgi:hypothetical protein
MFLFLCRGFLVWCSPIFSSVLFFCWAIEVLLGKLVLMPICSSVFPTTSCSCFKVSGLILRSLIYFEVIFVQDERHESNYSFLHADTQFSLQHLLTMLFSPLCILDTFVKNQVGTAMWIHIWVFCSIGLVCFFAGTMLLLLL